MCGRFVVSYTYEELLKFLEDDFDFTSILTSNTYPNYNVAPSEKVLTIIKTKDGFKAGDIKWGFKTHNHFLVNLRSETIDTLFKSQISNNRCLFVASGYYEWDHSKNPYYFHQDSILYFAGVYQKVDNNFQASIITKKANEDLYSIHDRMPVVLNNKEAKAYLENNDIIVIKNILKTQNSVLAHQVSRTVNKVSNNTIDNIYPYKENKLF